VSKPVQPATWAPASEWKKYAVEVAQYVGRNSWDVESRRTALLDLGLPAGNPLFEVTVTRHRVRATSEADAVAQVKAALSGVSFADRSGKTRNFRQNTTVTAQKV
jgi:hypothetical protein